MPGANHDETVMEVILQLRDGKNFMLPGSRTWRCVYIVHAHTWGFASLESPQEGVTPVCFGFDSESPELGWRKIGCMSPSDLSHLWEEHTNHEFVTRDTESTLATMADDA